MTTQIVTKYGRCFTSINLNGPKYKTVTDPYNLGYLSFICEKVLYSANIEMTSYANIFGVSNTNGYSIRVFKMFQKSPDVQRLHKKFLCTCIY